MYVCSSSIFAVLEIRTYAIEYGKTDRLSKQLVQTVTSCLILKIKKTYPCLNTDDFDSELVKVEFFLKKPPWIFCPTKIKRQQI